MNTEGTGFYTCKECHKTESLKNHTFTAHTEREQLGDQRNDGESNFNSGDGMGQMAQPWMFMMMMMMMMIMRVERLEPTHNIVQCLKCAVYSLHEACQFVSCCLQSDKRF
jgi:hypothetical protein